MILSLVWQERYNHIFEDNERSLNLLNHLLFGTLFQWAHIWGLSFILLLDCSITVQSFHLLILLICLSIVI